MPSRPQESAGKTKGNSHDRVPPKAFDALLVFVKNAGRLVRRDHLIESLWPETFVTDANLTNVIVAIRKVLGRDALQTVSKFGYRFTIPVIGEPGIEDATYGTFLRAKELAEFKSIDSMRQARDLFSVCVAADPTFASGWAWLGRCARFLDKFEHKTPTNLDLAQAAFQRALAIDPARLAPGDFSPWMAGLMGSLLAVLEDRRDEAAAIMRRADVHQEPETLFYFARHYAMAGHQADAIHMIERARHEGFTVSYALVHDHVFDEIRSSSDFQHEIDESQRVEQQTRHTLEATGLPARMTRYAAS